MIYLTNSNGSFVSYYGCAAISVYNYYILDIVHV